jgi:hypothetical protein
VLNRKYSRATQKNQPSVNTLTDHSVDNEVEGSVLHLNNATIDESQGPQGIKQEDSKSSDS